MMLERYLSPGPAARWGRLLVGGGALVAREEALRLLLPPVPAGQYADAQLDDYGGLPRRNFPWRPPLRLTLRARFSMSPLGTAGFGFWNNPFTPLGGVPVPPRAIWFFYASQPSDMALAEGVPGHGWKAATIDTLRPGALLWAPLAPLVVLLNRRPALRRRLWPHVQRAIHVAEAPLDAPLQEWHEYALEWHPDGARFLVDGRLALETDRSPRGPLGFVAWIDNQWAVATPEGRLRFGLLPTPRPQWLDLAQLRIENL